MYECHITIEPVLDHDRLQLVKDIAEVHSFKVAELLMVKKEGLEPSRHDTFMTAHCQTFEHLVGRMRGCVRHLKESGYKVWRYKIENIVIDSKYQDDPLRLL